jgi:probable F420-dependent oxidoreductase
VRVGYGLPVGGPAAGPEELVRVAQKAEELGFDSLWVWERLIRPVDPQVPYLGTADGSYPDVFKRVLDPLDTLTFVAAHTKRAALGTSIVNMPYHNPVILARRLTTIDVLSGGRVRAGLGLGWSKDEFDVVGRDQKRLGRLADEYLAVLKAVWTENPAEFHGEFYQLPRSYIDLKPVQKPHPPIYLAAYSPSGLKRIATRADGWTPVGIPPAGMGQMFAGVQAMAKEAGRDPNAIELVVRANCTFTGEPLAEDGRFPFYGSPDQIKADIQATREAGAHEILFDVSFSPDGYSLDGFLSRMDQVRELAGA